jgi:aspartyl protease family protein
VRTGLPLPGPAPHIGADAEDVMDGDTFGRMAYLILLLLAVAGWVLVEFRQRMGQALRMGLAWGLIILGLVAGYGVFQDIRTDILPQQSVAQDGRIELPRAADGHYYATLTINGEDIRFLADTGATNMVLSNADADRLGIDRGSLVFSGQASTANGVVRTARVRLPEVRFGPYDDQGFPAWVTDGEMDMSLLGMDYLGLYRIEIASDRMVLQR